MARQARVVIPGYPHHVTQRGNNRQDVFFVDADRREYLSLLKEQCGKFGLVVEAYCLMTNHVHLVAVPRDEQCLAKAIGRTNLYYTRHINRLHGRVGHLWQDRFFSCGLDESYFWSAMIYVERNPVRAGMAARAWEYPWSSAAAHVGGADTTGMLDMSRWRRRTDGRLDWHEALSTPQDQDMESRLRKWGYRGCPLGSDRFISKLETLMNIRLRPGLRGRPPKVPVQDSKNGNRPH
jgi:putative transposase